MSDKAEYGESGGSKALMGITGGINFYQMSEIEEETYNPTDD